MKHLVVYGEGVKYFYETEDKILEKQHLIKECDTFEEARELAYHLNKVLRGKRFRFNGYSVVYGKGLDSFFVIDGDEVIKDYELLIESFETEEEAQDKALNLNEINKGK